MKFVIQRVTHGEVLIDKECYGKINRGFVVLTGICDSDTFATADKMLQKMLNLRIFADQDGKTNLSIRDVGGELLIVSQFTLYADCKKGNRPSFVKAGSPEHAEELYHYIIEKCRQNGFAPKHGKFGADMQVSLINDGPFTIVLDSDEIASSIR